MRVRKPWDVDLVPLLYKKGTVAYTIKDGVVIPFYVDRTKLSKNQSHQKIRQYYCDCQKHTDVPPPRKKTKHNNFGRDRIRQNRNLFKTVEDAQSFLNNVN